MVENKYQITVNIKSKRYGGSIPFITANDHVIFEVEIYDGAETHQVSSNYLYTLVSTKADKASVIREGTIDGNLIRFELGSSEMTEPGKVQAQVQIYESATNKRISSAPMVYEVSIDPSLEGELPADDKTLIVANKTLLDDAITKANNADARIDNIVAQAGDSNTEIVDMRLRTDGTSASSAGSHIRELASHLAERAAEIKVLNEKPLVFSNVIKSFTNVSVYDAWVKSGVFYDESTDEFVLIFNARSAHFGVTDGDIYMAKKKGYGDFSTPTLVAQHDGTFGRRTHAAGILPNGNYMVIAMLDTTANTGNLIIYESSDKGKTWTNRLLLLNGQPISCYETSSIFVTNTGRLLTYARETNTQQNKVLYSDDNGVTWKFINIINYVTTNALEGEFVQTSNGTITCIIRDRLSSTGAAPHKALITRSIDNGNTWLPLEYTNLEMTISNCGILFDKSTKTIEMVVGSRLTIDGFGGSIRYYKLSEEDFLNENYGDGKIIAKANSPSWDFSYPGVAKNKNGVMVVCYYDQYATGAAIYHLMGNVADVGVNKYDTSNTLLLDGNFGKEILNSANTELFEVGTWTPGSTSWVKGKVASTIRLRTIDSYKFKKGDIISITKNSGFKFILDVFYDDGTFNSPTWITTAYNFTMPKDGEIGFQVAKSNDAAITLAELGNTGITIKRISSMTETERTNEFDLSILLELAKSTVLTNDPALFEQGAGSTNSTTYALSKLSSTTRIRTINAFVFPANSTFVIGIKGTFKFALNIFYDDGTKESVDWDSSYNNKKRFTKAGQFGITVAKFDDAAVVPNDITSANIEVKKFAL